MNDIVIVPAAGTAVGKFGGSLAKIPAPELGAAVIAELLKRAKLDGAHELPLPLKLRMRDSLFVRPVHPLVRRGVVARPSRKGRFHPFRLDDRSRFRRAKKLDECSRRFNIIGAGHNGRRKDECLLEVDGQRADYLNAGHR